MRKIIFIVILLVIASSSVAGCGSSKPKPVKVLEIGKLAKVQYFPRSFSHDGQWQLTFEDGYNCLADGGDVFSGLKYMEGFRIGSTYKVTALQNSYEGEYTGYPDVALVSEAP